MSYHSSGRNSNRIVKFFMIVILVVGVLIALGGR